MFALLNFNLSNLTDKGKFEFIFNQINGCPKNTCKQLFNRSIVDSMLYNIGKSFIVQQDTKDLFCEWSNILLSCEANKGLMSNVAN